MFMDEGEEIRFKIVEEVFIEISPTSNLLWLLLRWCCIVQSSMQGAEATVAIATSTTVADSNSHESKKESPYTIQVNILIPVLIYTVSIIRDQLVSLV